MNTSKKPVRMLILGTGSMARNHAEAYQANPNAVLVAGVDSRPENLSAFCADFGIQHQFTDLSDAISWGAFDAVSNVTPDAAHFATTMALLEAGKHVLCEKPLATNARDARAMADACRARGLIGMVNLTYRNVAALQEGAQLVRDGAIGNLRHFEASYLQSWLTQPAWGDWRTESQWLWRLSTEHGSKGVLGDVGIHILDFLTYAANSPAQEISCRLKTFHKAPGDRIGEYPLDANDSVTLQAELENGALGTLSASRFASGHLNDLRLRLYGDEGGLDIRFENQTGSLALCNGPDLEKTTWKDVPVGDTPTIYQRFISAICEDTPAEPDFERGANLQTALDLAIQSDAEGGRFLKVKD